MYPDEEIHISQRIDRAWVVSLTTIERPWAVERTREEALARAKQYAPEGVAHVRQPDGRVVHVPLDAARAACQLSIGLND
jgi:hypothetical protein